MVLDIILTPSSLKSFQENGVSISASVLLGQCVFSNKTTNIFQNVILLHVLNAAATYFSGFDNVVIFSIEKLAKSNAYKIL